MLHEDILDASQQPVVKRNLSPYKLGIGLSAINAAIWIVSFVFLRERLPAGTDLFSGLVTLSIIIGVLGMVATCFLGDSEKLFWNIFKTGFIYLELSLALGYVAIIVSSYFKEQSLVTEILLLPVYSQILILPLFLITSLFWLIPGHLVFYLQFIREYKEKMFK